MLISLGVTGQLAIENKGVYWNWHNARMSAMCKECDGNKFRDKEIKEIDVTPEMIEAGRDVIAANWLDFISDSRAERLHELLKETYLAMSIAGTLSHRV